MATAVSLAVLSAAALVGSSPALAGQECESCRPWWHLSSTARPTNLAIGAKSEIVVLATNVGDASAGGAAGPIVVEDELPPGVKLRSTPEGFSGQSPSVNSRGLLNCKKDSNTHATCTYTGSFVNNQGETIPKTLPPFDLFEIRLQVEAQSGGQTGELNKIAVAGPGAGPGASLSRPLTISAAPTPFGVEDYELAPEEAGGVAATQAGSHPFQLTTAIDLNQTTSVGAGSNYDATAAGLAKDLAFHWPPGLLGNPGPIPVCSLGDFLKKFREENLCRPESAVGVAMVTVDDPHLIHLNTFSVPIFALEPAFGEPARFGFYIAQTDTAVLINPVLRDGEGEAGEPDYGIDVTIENLPQDVSLLSSIATVWGVPGAAAHDAERGWGCLAHAREYNPTGGPLAPCLPDEESQPPAFLIMPTACSGVPLRTSIQADPWADPAALLTAPPSEQMPALDGCNQLLFGPSISAQPSTDRASAPSGLDFNLDFHDEGLTSGTENAQSAPKDTVVTLPEGFTINPSAGVGLAGCTPADYARETLDSESGAGCPNESKLGTVEVETPLLTQKIQGSLFIAQPYENPFPEPQAGHPNGTLVALYVVLKNPETGVLIKLAGKVTPNPVTGQLTTTFPNNPQLPFGHFNFHFREGQQAPLVTPALCGTYTTQAQLTPWSEPLTALTEMSSFRISKGFDGGACPSGGAPPFHPVIASGTLNNNAGASSSFYLHLTRTDAEQEISGFSTELPPGLTGDLSGIPFCPEADIALARAKNGVQEEAEPSCPAASQVGHTLVGTGVGAVLAYVPGRLYLAGAYNGDPFSLVSVTSARVGPFDLGTVVLRFGLRIDPNTAQVSVDPSASEPIPTILDGIVTHVRDIRVYVDRSNFILNPTSCNPMSISSTLNSSQGQSATISSPFQATNCATLGFAPKFAVDTSGKTSKADGASLSVKLTYPSAPPGSQANIRQVKVELPKALPSRLTTLQKACTAAQFNSNPAGCPAESVIGHAKAITPLIPVPLEGPAYFVSHGGEAFPSLIVVLQGASPYNIMLDLVGSTFISKAGITSSTFKTVPDAPVGSFELTLPEGKYSALAANGNLCTSKLAMPTEFLAQNGTKINRSTAITVTGCSNAITVVSHAVKGRNLTVAVSVPASGELVVSGKGLSKALKTSKGRETVMFKLSQKRAGKLRTTVQVTFTPSAGKNRKKQSKALHVQFKK